MSEFEALTPGLREVLDSRFEARERGIAGSRAVIRNSANAIRALHREEWDSAAELCAKAGDILADVTSTLSAHPDVLHAGFVHDAAKEYAEASVCEAIFRGRPLPTAQTLGIDVISYLHGLGEAVGELRRRMLDRLRADDLSTAENCLRQMDQIVDLLASLDYPDGMTAGLRRTTDVSRSLVERSRADLTTTVIQERLRSHLDR
ncbi:MAG TPA: haloacid dehalogenase [Acidimicrobiia bacterium]